MSTRTIVDAIEAIADECDTSPASTSLDDIERTMAAALTVTTWALEGLAAQIRAGKHNNTPVPHPVKPAPRPQPKQDPKPPPPPPPPDDSAKWSF